MPNMSCGGCQECKKMYQFYCSYCVEKGWDGLIWDTTAFKSSALLATTPSGLQVGKTHLRLCWISLSS